MTVKNILAEYLTSHGFDGLCHPDTECGCGLEDLIGPCEGAQRDCQPAHRIQNPEGDPWYTIAFIHLDLRPTEEEAREDWKTEKERRMSMSLFESLNNWMKKKPRHWLVWGSNGTGLQQVISPQRRNGSMKKIIRLGVFIVTFSFLPITMSWAGERVQTSSKNHTTIHVSLDRLTDIAVPEKVTRVITSDPSDFKIEIVQEKSLLHLVIKPLKAVAKSDLFVFGVNHVYYLRVKTVEKGKPYAVHVGIRGYKAE